jgi:Arc/MetJ family transcription regulator
MAKSYAEAARHRTTLILSVALLQEAEEAVGSTSATETVTIALRELVARRRRERLLSVDLPDLTPQSVGRLRRPRFPSR